MSEFPAGTHAFGPQDGQLLLKVFREGVASKMGHDLTIEVKDWSAKVDANPDDLSQTSIEADAQVPSFSVLEGTGGAKPLSRTDKSDIKKNIDEKILTGSPTISFRTTGAPNGNGSSYTVPGELTVNGATRPTTVNVAINGDKAKVTFKVVQSEFGIKPFKALMGALKVRDQVDVEWRYRSPPAARALPGPSRNSPRGVSADRAPRRRSASRRGLRPPRRRHRRRRGRPRCSAQPAFHIRPAGGAGSDAGCS